MQLPAHASRSKGGHAGLREATDQRAPLAVSWKERFTIEPAAVALVAHIHMRDVRVG